MKRYCWERFGDLDGLVLREVDTPAPGPREVLVRVRANSLNQRDLMVARGIPVGGPLRPGLVPLSDGAGEVVAIGSEVTRWRPGDRVAAIFRQAWLDGEFRAEQGATDLGGTLDGMLAEFVLLHEDGLVRLPEHLTFEEGAALACAAVTAWNAVITKGSIKPGEAVLVQGSGGVSLCALQFARLAGARVIAITSAAEKATRLTQLGADAVINYSEQPAWDAEVLRLTEGRGVDLVVEIGGAGTVARSLAATRVGGKVVLVGLLTGFESNTTSMFAPTFLRDLTIKSVHVGSRASFEAMNAAIAYAKLRPIIDRSFAFSNARDAYRYLQAGAHFGKVVIAH